MALPSSRPGQEGTPPCPIALDVLSYVEKDAMAVAANITKILQTLQSSLEESTDSSIEHMRVHHEAANQLQSAAVDAAAKGHRFINECLKLDNEMRDVPKLATKLGQVRAALDQFEQQANKYLPR